MADLPETPSDQQLSPSAENRAETAADGPAGAPTGLARLNAAPLDEAIKLLGEVCTSRAWLDAVASRRPYRDPDELFGASDIAMAGLTSADLDEAMAGHAVIGKPRAGDATSQREQAGVRGVGDDVLAELADANREYLDRFGHVFLICATGKGAAQMLAALRSRLGNDAATERAAAREELRKINRIRLEKLVLA